MFFIIFFSIVALNLVTGQDGNFWTWVNDEFVQNAVSEACPNGRVLSWQVQPLRESSAQRIITQITYNGRPRELPLFQRAYPPSQMSMKIVPQTTMHEIGACRDVLPKLNELLKNISSECLPIVAPR